jgi:glutathione S-transferase
LLPELHGFNLNPRVMAARLALAEKGVAHRFQERKLGDIAGLRPDELIQQLGSSMPALVHGGVALYELEAILRYIDEEFPGPALQPPTGAGRALMTQIMAIMRDQLHPCAIGAIVGPKVLAPLVGKEAASDDQSEAEARLGEILALIGDMSASWVARPGRRLAGPAPPADMQLAPILSCSGHPKAKRAGGSGN